MAPPAAPARAGGEVLAPFRYNSANVDADVGNPVG